METIQIQLLGNFQITLGGTTVIVTQPAQQALLAYLLLHRAAPVARQDVAQQLFPKVPSFEAVAMVDQLLTDLAQRLPGASRLFALAANTVQWRLDGPYSLDVADFEQALARAQLATQAGQEEAVEQHLTAAVQAYRGDLLPACADDWLVAERRRLQAQYLETLTQLVPILEQKRNYAQAVEYARMLRRHRAGYESTHRRLAHLHVLSGGRAGLVQSLEQRLAALMQGQGALVLIQGMAGIGKTSLALACEAQAHRLGADFVVGHCYERGVTSPFNPWQEALAALALLKRVDPGTLPEPFGQGPPVQSAHQLIQVLMAQIQRTAAERPLVVLLDDLHWADQESLDLLDFATRQLTHISLLVLVTYRSEEVHRGQPLFNFLPTLQRNRPIEMIYLGLLSLDDTARLVEAYHGPCSPQLARYLDERAEGHPLFLVQLLNDLAERKLITQDALGRWLPPAQNVAVPTLLQQVISERIMRLGREAEQFLEVAAVVGESWELAVVEAVLEWPEEQLLAVLEQALDAGVLAATDSYTERYRFGHGLIREVLYNRQLVRRRKQLHGRIIALLAKSSPVDAAALAHHAYLAELWPQAHYYSLAAGDEARRRYAMHTALQFYQQALNAVQKQPGDAPVELLLTLYQRLGETYVALSHKEEAVTAFTQVIESARTAGNLRAEGQALIQLAINQDLIYRPDEADQTSRKALQVAEQVGDGHMLALSHFLIGRRALLAGDLAQSHHHLALSQRYAQATGEPDLLAQGMQTQIYLIMWAGRYVQAERMAREALELARKAR
jgi:DNA-binding SARP family transcriptional activator/tetratricopeptide (TPR) repeat protein